MVQFYYVKFTEEFETEKGETKMSKAKRWLVQALDPTDAMATFTAEFTKYGVNFEVLGADLEKKYEKVLLNKSQS